MMNFYFISAILLFMNVQVIKSDKNSLSDFYPKLRDEFVSSYRQLYGGNYFPWKLLDLVPFNRALERTSFPSFVANKKIDPMLFKIGLGKRNYRSIDPFLFKIGLGKKLVERDAEDGGGQQKRYLQQQQQQIWPMKNSGNDYVVSFKNRLSTQRMSHVLLPKKNAADLNSENFNSFSDLNM